MSRAELGPRLLRMTLEFPLQNLAHQCRIRLAFAQLHYLPFEEIQRRGLARFVIGSRPWIGGDGLVAKSFDCPGVADLCQAFFFDDLGWRLARNEHFSKYILSNFGADSAALDKLNQLEDRAWLESQVCQLRL